ncbi:MAG: ORF6N domain-containing protein [Candidatus Margulisbacteria bacterium]|jgi:hypothetical protein|nr:ORF6N domain-containing protein [Candidatus Margulisiibacteriota bacterium]
MKKRELLVSAEIIENKIFLLREKKVMLDKDLALLYGVMTRDLNKAVKRNLKRFPADFMFQLSRQEFKTLMFQFGTSNRKTRGGVRKLPYVFTEQGVAMLSSVLHSNRAIFVNIQIMRTFTKLREIMFTHKELQTKIEQLFQEQKKHRSKLSKYDKQIAVIFDAIKRLLQNDAVIQRRLVYGEEKEKNKKWGFQPPVKKQLHKTTV